MTTKILDLNNVERKLFWAFSVLFVGLIVFYLYSAFSLTVAGVERGQMLRASHALSLKVGDLESEYMGIQNSITLSSAEKLGFREVVVKFTPTTVLNDVGAKLSLVR